MGETNANNPVAVLIPMIPCNEVSTSQIQVMVVWTGMIRERIATPVPHAIVTLQGEVVDEDDIAELVGVKDEDDFVVVFVDKGAVLVALVNDVVDKESAHNDVEEIINVIFSPEFRASVTR